MTDALQKLRFERLPSPVLAEHRPLYKIGQVLLILDKASRGSRSSLPRLQLFNWALKAKDRMDALSAGAEGKQLSVPAWGFDPMLAIAVRIAIADGLIEETTTGYRIARSGEELLREIDTDPSMFATEKAFLKVVGKSVTETMVDAAAKQWEA